MPSLAKQLEHYFLLIRTLLPLNLPGLLAAKGRRVELQIERFLYTYGPAGLCVATSASLLVDLHLVHHPSDSVLG